MSRTYWLSGLVAFSLVGCLVVCLELGASSPGAASLDSVTLETGFRTPPDEAKPWVYWWWLNGNVTKESITHDLEEMKDKGIGGFLMFDSRGYHDDNLPPPPAINEFLDPEWRGLLKHAMSEAHRLGLRMSMNLSTSAGALLMPGETGANGPKQLVWTNSSVTGPGRVTGELKKGKGAHLWDVALLAVRVESDPKSAQPSNGKSVTDDLSGGWRQIIAEPGKARTRAAEVVDLTSAVDSGNRFSWNVPAGQWRLIRFACVRVEGFEKSVDILNAKAVEDYFHAMADPILKDAGALVGKTLTHFYSVSWEGGGPNWTPGFENEFVKYRGYSPINWLPVLAGLTVKDEDHSVRFLEDYSRTLGDCFRENSYGKLLELCHKAGVKWHSESGGPWGQRNLVFQYTDELEYWARNDMPQGEFWQPAEEENIADWRGNCRRTATAARIYGKQIAAAESFTHMIRHWIMYPARLKPQADIALIDGINQFIWHTFAASPASFGKPGIIYFAGTHLNPNVTWWEQSRAFLSYLSRCQFMLRQGQYVADVACYIGARNNSNWTRDTIWSNNASLRLRNGYKYDVLSKEVLLGRLSVKDGRLTLPGGPSYSLLVLDLEEDGVGLEILQKVSELSKAGATVVLGKLRPARVRGLSGFPASEKKLREAADELWGAPGNVPFHHSLGKGVVAGGVTLNEVLLEKGILPDFEGPFEFNHHKAEAADIYFLSGQGSAECTFRIKDKEPELWDPTTGQSRASIYYRSTADGRTAVPISLPKRGSLFVVFRKPAAYSHPVSASPSAESFEVEGSGGVRFWKPGQYAVQASGGEENRLVVKDLPAPLQLAGPWTVHFAPGMGAPESAVFDSLTPWNERPEDGIKYFSGTATYSKTFELDKAVVERPVRLKLGEVKNIAEVRLNGKSLGIVWTDPWTIDLTAAVKAGKNELEIEVTNLWVNRLIGDAGLPKSKRYTQTNAGDREPDKKYRYANLRGYLSTDPLVRSGLLGPVIIEFGEHRSLAF